MVSGLRFHVWVFGCRVLGVGFWVSCVGFGVHVLGFGVWV